MSPVRTVVIAFLLLIAPHCILGQFVQQGPALRARVDPFSSFGGSVDLSADGDTALVGDSFDELGLGAAWIFTRSGGVWMQRAKLVDTAAVGARQGASVSLSADGNTALVGGPFDGSDSLGAAWVFTRSGDVWSQQGGKLVGTGAVGPARQGGAVSLSADGNTAIVAGPGDNAQVGAAWVFVRDAGVWMQQGTKLVPTFRPGPPPGFGRAVSLSADGNTAAIGGLQGEVWIWVRNAGIWTEQTKIAGSLYLGFSVAISSAGNRVVAGEPDNGVGKARVFRRDGAVWTEEAVLIGSGTVGRSGQGASVSISADGTVALVGGPSDGFEPVGATWVFTRTGTTWTQQGSKLVGTGAFSVRPAQGASVALSADGDTAIVGAWASHGFVWIFVSSRQGGPAEVAVPMIGPAGLLLLAVALGVAGILVRRN